MEMLMHNPSLWTLLGALHGTPDFDKVTVALVDVRVLAFIALTDLGRCCYALGLLLTHCAPVGMKRNSFAA